MVTRIVVPLDGSTFGEQAIPVALRIAERDRATIDLVHVYEAVASYVTQGVPHLDPRLDEELREDRAAYIEAIAVWVRRDASAPVTTSVLEGPVGATLAGHVASRRADLVVMATHGRGGLSRVWLGSTALDLVRGASAPVLLVKPDAALPLGVPTTDFRRVLIPLDGSPAGEAVIPHALAVAGQEGVSYLLLHVVTPIAYLAESADVAFVHESELEAGAERYLAQVASRFTARGVAMETRVVTHAQPARAILESSDETAAELIAMATHGRSGVTRLLVGSVTDKVVRASGVPVLLQRPQPDAAAPPPGERSRARATRA